MMRRIFESGTLRMFPYTSVLIRTNKASEKITAVLCNDVRKSDQREILFHFKYLLGIISRHAESLQKDNATPWEEHPPNCCMQYVLFQLEDGD